MQTSGENRYSVIIKTVIEKDGNILISRRGLGEKHGPGKWSIPGGKLEATGIAYEALQQTAKREALEEAGVEIEDSMDLIANNTFEHNEDGLQAIAIVFLCHWKSGNPKPLKDTIDVRWINQEEVENFDFHNINVKNYVLKGFNFQTKPPTNI